MNDPSSGSGFVFPCKHLRSKEMYYQSDQTDGDEYSGDAYWCAKSFQSFGPDGGSVLRSECTSARACFEE